MNIVIYTKSGCPNCVTAKRLLDDKGIGYEEKSMDNPDIHGGAPGVVTHLPCTHRPSWLKRKLGEWATGFKWEDYK